MFTEKMNDYDYCSNYMYKTVIPKINTGLTTIFGNHLIKYRERDTDGWHTNNSSYYDAISVLCSSVHVLNKQVSSGGDSCYYAQFPIFKLNTNFRTCTNSSVKRWWLSNYYYDTSADSSSDYYYEHVVFDPSSSDKYAYTSSYSVQYGVRPYFLLGY